MRGDQVVVVTGGSAGVGRAVARVYGRRGCAVGLIARGRDGLQAAREEIVSWGGRGIVLPCDVADFRAVDAAADAVEQAFGPISVWINNATTSVYAPLLEMTAEEFRRVTEVTYLGTVYGTMAALRRMTSRNRGTIVQIGSALAYRGFPLQSAYCGAKHAIQGFTESVRTELRHDRSRVRISMVHLPALNTPQFDWSKSRLARRLRPAPPVFQPEVAAEAIVWAAEHAPRELSVGFLTSLAPWANRVAPQLMDGYLAATAYEAQQASEPEDPGRPDNLWEPVPGDHGAHGRFDAEAADRSLHLAAVTHRGLITAALGALAGGTAALRRRRRPQRDVSG